MLAILKNILLDGFPGNRHRHKIHRHETLADRNADLRNVISSSTCKNIVRYYELLNDISLLNLK